MISFIFLENVTQLEQNSANEPICILLKYMTYGKYGVSTNTALRYVNSVIRPILEYGAPVYYATEERNQSNIARLESFYRKCLRYAMGIHPRAPNNKVYIESGTEPIFNRIRKLTINTILRVRDYPLDHPLHSNILEYANSHEYFYHSRPQGILSDVLVDKVIYQNANQPHFVRYMNGPMQKLSKLGYFDRDKLRDKTFIMPLPKTKSKMSEDELKLEKDKFTNSILQLGRYALLLYTDGSINSELNRTTFGIYPSRIINRKGKKQIEKIKSFPSITGVIKASSYVNSSLVPELTAIWKALQLGDQIINHEQNLNKVIIITDSMSGIHAILSEKKSQ